MIIIPLFSWPLIDPSMVSSTLDLGQSGKIRWHHWKEHHKISKKLPSFKVICWKLMKMQLLKVAKFKDICMLWSTNLLSTIKRFVNFCNFADQSYIFKALKRALSSGVDIFPWLVHIKKRWRFCYCLVKVVMSVILSKRHQLDTGHLKKCWGKIKFKLWWRPPTRRTLRFSDQPCTTGYLHTEINHYT